MSRYAAFVGHALVGWAICGTTIAVARQVLSMPNALLVHAIVAPLAFALLSMHFFRRYPAASPLGTVWGSWASSSGWTPSSLPLSLSAVTRCSRVRSAPGFLLLPYGCQASLSAMRADDGKRGIDCKRDARDRMA